MKTWVIAKEDKHEEASELFEGTGVNITTSGKRYLGGAVGKETFVNNYIMNKITEWVKEVNRLALFAKTQPHAAFAAFTKGLIGRWVYLIRVTQIWEILLQPLEDEIRHSLLPTLTGQAPVNDQVCKLCALPARHGGLGIVNLTTLPAKQHQTLRKITQPLGTQILQQSGDPLQAKVT